ncbi:hypothetical protein I3843_03G180100 [Carya illinoinensis]|nr:hypothetical protein I3843_03G180100 [Carya illinoinensis]
MQLMLPSIPRNLRCLSTESNQTILLPFGNLKYSLKKIFTMTTIKFFKLSIVVLFPIRMYPSMRLAVTLYTNILSAILYLLQGR